MQGAQAALAVGSVVMSGITVGLLAGCGRRATRVTCGIDRWERLVLVGYCSFNIIVWAGVLGMVARIRRDLLGP